MSKAANYDELLGIFLGWRGIEPGEACNECNGSGVTTYGSTATWRGSIGGQALTLDVCDRCWGSGSRLKPWPSRRRVASPEGVASQGG